MAMFPSKEAQSVLVLASSSTTPTSIGLFEAHITKTTQNRYLIVVYMSRNVFPRLKSVFVPRKTFHADHSCG